MQTETLRVAQSEDDRTLSSEQLKRFRAGDYLADGMSHGCGDWSWTRVRVVANDTRSRVIVVRFPDGEYAAGPWDEFDSIYADWSKVCDHAPIDYLGASWAA